MHKLGRNSPGNEVKDYPQATSPVSRLFAVRFSLADPAEYGEIKFRGL